MLASGQEKVSKVCSEYWTTMLPVSEHPYLKAKQVKIFDSWLSKDGSKIHDVLCKHGLDIGTDGKTKRKLNEFLNLINPMNVITYTVRSGWHGRSFLTATQAYGQSDGSLIHIPAAEPAKLSISGTLEEWQINIAELCKGNSRLMLAVSASFASMILNLCRAFNTFTTCGIGGLLATKYNITNWHDLDIMELIMRNFFSWLENKGGVGSQEDKQALNQVCVFFEKYGDSRFQFMDDGQPSTERPPHERAGYRTYRRGEPLFSLAQKIDLLFFNGLRVYLYGMG